MSVALLPSITAAIVKWVLIMLPSVHTHAQHIEHENLATHHAHHAQRAHIVHVHQKAVHPCPVVSKLHAHRSICRFRPKTECCLQHHPCCNIPWVCVTSCGQSSREGGSFPQGTCADSASSTPPSGRDTHRCKQPARLMQPARLTSTALVHCVP